MSHVELVHQQLERSAHVLGSVDPAAVAAAAAAIDVVASQGGRVYTCGNGGSAATAIHFASDLLALRRRPRVDAVALPANIAALTSVANDLAYDECFAVALDGRIRAGDALVVVSVSGNSVNVVRALEVAQAAGATCVGILANGGGKALDLCDVAVTLPTAEPYLAEGVHEVVLHTIASALAASTTSR